MSAKNKYRETTVVKAPSRVTAVYILVFPIALT